MTNINLDECELLLWNFYNLTNNETLYMKILEIRQEGMKIPKVEYDVHCKLFDSKIVKLFYQFVKIVKYLYQSLWK